MTFQEQTIKARSQTYVSNQTDQTQISTVRRFYRAVAFFAIAGNPCTARQFNHTSLIVRRDHFIIRELVGVKLKPRISYLKCFT